MGLPGLVFSAHAEVVPITKTGGSHAKGILRARGGSSLQIDCIRYVNMYSPRTRR